MQSEHSPHPVVIDGVEYFPAVALVESLQVLSAEPLGLRDPRKTFTGARMICELVRQGKKVGITAISHKVIQNLLLEMIETANEAEPSRCVQLR